MFVTDQILNFHAVCKIQAEISVWELQKTLIGLTYRLNKVLKFSLLVSASILSAPLTSDLKRTQQKQPLNQKTKRKKQPWDVPQQDAEKNSLTLDEEI